MNVIYISLALLTLYGDLVKRYLPDRDALVILYSLACFILLVMMFKAKKKRPPLCREAKTMKFFVFSLVILYLLQMLISFDELFIPAVTHSLYMCIPLMYIVIILEFFPQFDLVKFSHIFLIMMLPINVIGFIQHKIDPTFLISTVYSGEHGGVILRNLFEGGVFNRYPSIFVSADRYSGMGLMQLYFTFVLLLDPQKLSKRGFTWVLFNFLCGIAALLIAGARSRILIILIEVILFAVVSSMRLLNPYKYDPWKKHRKLIVRIMLTFVVSFILIGFYQTRISDFPVIGFLEQSFQQGDIPLRVGESGSKSLMPDDITFGGQGLGSVGEGGKPGEFGIYSMWIESGFFWGILMLIAFGGMLWTLFVLSFKQFHNKDPIGIVICSFPLLLLIFALLAGLTSAFELSSGIILCCSIAYLVVRFKQHRI